MGVEGGGVEEENWGGVGSIGRVEDRNLEGEVKGVFPLALLGWCHGLAW